jgi:hypothetical protein
LVTLVLELLTGTVVHTDDMAERMAADLWLAAPSPEQATVAFGTLDHQR